jgi:hypothetical protein
MRQPAEPLIVDIEASGFGVNSYPIEVGLALENGEEFCTLITPAPDWQHWDIEAEKIHRVTRDILEIYGRPMEEVARQLNDLLRAKTLYTDGWVVDKPWLNTLFQSAGIEMEFSVRALEMILTPSQMEVWHQTKQVVIEDLSVRQHRARADAAVIQETYKRTLKHELRH